MDLSKVLSISGKPDLSELVSQTKGGAIVRNLVSGQKFPVFKNDRISALAEIRIYAVNDEVPLEDVLKSIYEKENAQAVSFDFKKCESKQLFEYFAQVMPQYDPDRVHASDVKKILSWYNILLAAGKLTPDADEESASAEAKQE